LAGAARPLIGLLYAARGIGAAAGPIIARRIGGESPKQMRRAISVAFFTAGIFYLIFSQALSLPLAAIAVLGSHMGGSTLWVFSTTLLHLVVPDRYRGRVFAANLGLLTLSMSLSNYFTGWGLDTAKLYPRALAAILGLIFFIPGIIWAALQIFWPWAEDNKQQASDGEIADQERSDER